MHSISKLLLMAMAVAPSVSRSQTQTSAQPLPERLKHSPQRKSKPLRFSSSPTSTPMASLASPSTPSSLTKSVMPLAIGSPIPPIGASSTALLAVFSSPTPPSQKALIYATSIPWAAVPMTALRSCCSKTATATPSLFPPVNPSSPSTLFATPATTLTDTPCSPKRPQALSPSSSSHSTAR